ncbi:MAG: hypothetical protein UF228_11180 [Lachnospiraceae bacterium]|nr:hypothetical protein [Lachnospiraceae bacterium]
MTKTIEKLTMVTLLITMFSTFALGCGNDKAGNKETEAPTTTTEKEVTTQEPTTVEHTTEEPTTVHVKQGVSIIVEKNNAEHFNDLVIESGHIFNINDFCSDADKSFDSFRGNNAFIIMTYIGIDTAEFESKYFPDGAQAPKIPLADNYSFKYTGNKKFACALLNEIDGYVYFDLYEVK